MKKKGSEKEKQERLQRGRFCLRTLKKLFPRAGMMLHYRNPWELLVAVELSARCTDKKVNEVTEVLFKKYPTLHNYATASPHAVERLVHPTGFYRNKTKNIIAAARMIEKEFHGTVPKTMSDILRIPGVGRKTANVVLGNAYGVAEGIAVDTHVRRLARTLGLSDETDVNKIEKDLMEIFPKKDWSHVTHLFIQYGRTYCPSRRHDPAHCPLGHYVKKIS